MADNKKSVNLLPDYLKTDKNSKFFSGTIDPFIKSPDLERIDGFVGSILTPNYDSNLDSYIQEDSLLRKNYSLEPALVFKDSASNITDVIGFDDIINEIQIQGGKTDNLNKLFQSKFYSFDPYIDWDKLVNYTQYFWLHNGPDAIIIDKRVGKNNLGLPYDITINVDEDIIGKKSYTMPNGYPLSNGLKVRFTSSVLPVSYREKEYYVEGVGSFIKLINTDLLDVNELVNIVYNETFDSDKFDSYPFDGSKKTPLVPEYITINRASKDLNPWSRYNRWFHSEIIRITALCNGINFILPLDVRAKRPIIEFKPNLQLYKFGEFTTGTGKVSFIDTSTTDAFKEINGSLGYYVDGVLLSQNDKIIFNADIQKDDQGDFSVRGNIYNVTYNYSQDPPTLQLSLLYTPTNLESVVCNSGIVNEGTSWHYNASSTSWIKSQQHTKINQAPLFDLYDNEQRSYSDNTYYNTGPIVSDFNGSKIFGYKIGTGTPDAVLGFPLKYQNSVGIGSYLFENYFTTNSIDININGIGSSISTGVTYFKYTNEYNQPLYVNVWNESATRQTPILEIQTIVTSTYTATIHSVEKLIDVTPYINSKLTTATLSFSYIKNGVSTSTAIASTGGYTLSFASTETSVVSTFDITFNKKLNVNDVLSLKINSTATTNSNGYYETPISLTNNPLNSSISEMTLSELSDHLSTMVIRREDFFGEIFGSNNLRDIYDYTKYGHRLIVNSNPISYAKIFLGKKEHNVVDALRHASDQYNQFKMNLLRAVAKVDFLLTPANALDKALIEINNSKDNRSPYYRSDMLGYGPNKVITTYDVTDVAILTYPFNIDFSLSDLSFKSVLVYVNNTQLTYGLDYSFSQINGINNDEITFSNALAVGDVISIHYYPDTLGCFVPSTPSKLGLYPSYEPVIYIDDSYISGGVLVIQGHDGSIMTAYNDYRDNIILEYEKRVYNNIKVQYDSKLFDVKAVLPGKFRQDRVSTQDAIDILTKDFTKWIGTYNIDATTNTIFDDGNPLTWNYTGSIMFQQSTVANSDLIYNEPVSGFWRNVYKYFYDTDRPDTHPWEMLGHFIKPAWWDNYYSWTNSEKRANLITAITKGYTNEPPDLTVNTNYARPGFSDRYGDSIAPVNSSGVLLAPADLLIYENSYYEKIADWKFGDHGPAETAWRRSSYWPFALNIAAALIDPCSYTSAMYDTSRTSINSSTNQITYLQTDLYLNPNKLFIEGYNDAQTSGFGVYIVEKGLQKNLNYLNVLKEDLNYINFNLFHKVGGFVSKDKLQIIIDSIDPVSQAPGAILPQEDYTLILNVSNPIKSASISGIIVQKSDGKFIVKGYDKSNPYFEIYSPIKSSSGGALTIGGKSEKFTEWSSTIGSGSLGSTDVSSQGTTSRYYKQGQLVRYNGKYYRVKGGHSAQPTFDPTLFYPLPSLPMTGGATIQVSNNFENTLIKIPYGTSFSTIQEVYDLLIGYGAYLESQGFIFDEFNSNLNEIIDWKFTGKEFLYWTTQNWADGNLITLSPFADYLKYSFTNSIVDNIATGNYEYSLLKADGTPFPIDKFRLSREDGVCTINTLDTSEGIFFATLNSVQKEHAIVFNNTTIFNDTIYKPETGYKQRRIRFSGFRTLNWNGDLSSPGFVYDSVNITDWVSYGNYIPGKVVRYNGSYFQANEKIINDGTFNFNKWVKLNDKPTSTLLPNFDYKISQFEDFYSLDIDNFDATQQELAQHLIGYTPRTYFNNIFTNPIAQYKFYQGFIKEKGTKNAIDKLSKVGKFTRQGEILFNEEWAFRAGQYGSFSTYNEIEVTLNEGSTLENPYIVKFVSNTNIDKNPLINYKSPLELLITPNEYVPTSTFNTYPSTFSDNNIELITAGYVRSDDVSATAYNKNSLLDIANNSLILEGNTIWLGFLENGGWTVYRYSNQVARIAGVYVSSPAIDITFTTNINHNLLVGDIISIVRFNNQVDGIHIVTAIPSLDQFTVASELTTIENAELLSYGSLFKFEEARYSDISEIIKNKNFFKLKEGEKFWVDSGANGKWQVYEKIKNYSSSTIFGLGDYQFTQQLGKSIFASDDTDVVMISAPNRRTIDYLGSGSVSVFKKNKITGIIEEKFEYYLNTAGVDKYCKTSYNSTRAEVILAFAANNLAEVYPSEIQILYWMNAGLGTNNGIFNDNVIIRRVANGSLATSIDAARAADNLNTVNTRAEVITAYQNNLDAPLYPDEASIRYWMLNGLGINNEVFNWSIQNTEYQNPGYIKTNQVERDGASKIYNEFGTSLAYDISKGIFIAGAPAASYVRAPDDVAGSVIFSNGTTYKSFEYEGLVKISTANDLFFKEHTEKVLVNPYATTSTVASHSRFGHSIYVNQVDSKTSSTLLVGAPGDSVNTYTGRVYAYSIYKTASSVEVSAHPYGINVESQVSLKFGSQFGHKIAGDQSGTIIAISAPTHAETSNTGLVQLYDNNLKWLQTIRSPFGTSHPFGSDLSVSSDGSYIFVSSVDAKLNREPRGKIAVYKQSGTQRTFMSSRPAVILAYAENVLAPLYPTEEEIHYWMITGLGTNNEIFNAAILNDRNEYPYKAASTDADRAVDAKGIMATRGEVVAAYQNNVDAQIYPDEDSIRYWMINGLGPSVVGFSNEIEIFNAKNPGQYSANMVERAAATAAPPYQSSRADVLYAFAANLLAEVNPSESQILFWMSFGLGVDYATFNSDVTTRRAADPTLADEIDADRLADATGITSAPIIASRAEVLLSFKNNLDAILYPTEVQIRFYMTYGIFTLNNDINTYNSTRPDLYFNNLKVRAADTYPLLATRPQVIYAYAANLLASVYPTEFDITYWMVHGLDNFDSKILQERASNPTLAAFIDADRINDKKDIQSSRADVIKAYQDNVNASIYPSETNIRRWMLAGINSYAYEIFNAAVIYSNENNPAAYEINLTERATAYNLLDYYFALHQIIDNPIPLSDLKFGNAISISKDNSTLAIGALGSNNSTLIEFDKNFKNGETLFDGGSTKFTNPITNSGVVYVYTNLDGYFVYSEEIADPLLINDGNYGYSLAATNSDIFIGAPATTRDSRAYQNHKIDSSVNGSLKVLREESNLVDVSKIDRVVLIDSSKEEIIEYLDVIDPLKGKIAGIAEQELKYKSSFDPATYSIGIASTIVDTTTSWIDDHIGELWWDLSTAKYTWYEQGNEIFRKNNWGKLFPGASIDVYEWVKSDLLPSEWAAQADTNDGLTKGISGQPKYPDNSSVSIKQLFNNITNSFENVYFFWVKNKVTVPNVKNRRISSYQVASIILDPAANGLKFAEIISADAVALANIQPMLIDDKINLNIAMNTNGTDIPRHTEWVLLAEGDLNSVPTNLLEKKLFDSLLGHDSFGNLVPDPTLTYRNSYGIGIRPQQSLFKDRISALRNQIEFANSILIENRITGNYNFNNLSSYELPPDNYSREYDRVVEDITERNLIDTSLLVQAELICSVYNGKIASVEISNPGYGYELPPLVRIISSTGKDAVILTEINNIGQVINAVISNAGLEYVDIPKLIVRPYTIIVSVDSTIKNIWSKQEFNSTSVSNDSLSKWVTIKNQSYDTRSYWKYVDWTKSDYKKFKEYSYVISDPGQLDSLVGIVPGNYVKVNNIGDGKFVILEKTSLTEVGDFSIDYNFVYIENGTIQILESIWNFSNLTVPYDNATLEETTYDQVPDIELYYILVALKEDIFVRELKVNWNKFFFAAVKYALTEQKLLDWAFKTSFINVFNIIGSLDQRPIYKLDNEKYFEDYIREVKPYHTNIRTYTSNYSYLEDTTNSLSTTDFDLTPYYDTTLGKFNVVNTSTITNTFTNLVISNPEWKPWIENFTYNVGSITVANPGTLYSQRPIVRIIGSSITTATAEAYIRDGGIYKIIVTDPGSGYTQTPIIEIVGGGINVTVTATASASLINLTTRKNIIGLKFNRVSYQSEIGDTIVNDTFTCSGKDNKFVLSLLADPDKATIVPTLDSKLILSNDYTLEYYTEKYQGSTKRYSRFVFLNYVPNKDQVFNITYNKNIDLYTAVDRIIYAGNTNTDLSSVMEGIIYPNNIIQGLPFGYSTGWDIEKYDVQSVWGEAINYYASAKLASSVTAGTSTLYLNTTSNIVPGQIINIINSSTSRIRPDTLVQSVNRTENSITLTQPTYIVDTVKSTATNIGSDIVITTKLPFNGGIVAGDIVTVDGIEVNLTPEGVKRSGLNGTYSVSSIIDVNKFIVKANSVLGSTSTIVTFGEAYITISTTPVNISTGSVQLNYIRDVLKPVLGETSIVVDLMTPFNDITKFVIFRDNVTEPMETGIPVTGPFPSKEYYYITKDLVTGRAIATFYQMEYRNYILEIHVYGNPIIEFWKTNFDQNDLDSSITGGSYEWSNLIDGSGTTFNTTSVLLDVGSTSIVLDGDSFLNVRDGYSPEELVSGHVLDSLGVNVYTKKETSYPTVVSGAFRVIAGTTTTSVLNFPETESAGMIVNVNGLVFERVGNKNELINSRQYYMVGNTIYIPPQGMSGHGGYTMVSIGGDYSVLDSNSASVVGDDGVAIVMSLLSSINDVSSVYVLVDGLEIPSITDEEEAQGYYGYMLFPLSSNNNRASVRVYHLTPGTHFIQVWFLQSKYTKFNRVHEEVLISDEAGQSIFTLSFKPEKIEPVSSEVIVEIDDPDTGRRRLSPPWTSYYQFTSNQLTYVIDNKNTRAPGSYSANTVFVYANGVKLRPGFDYTLNNSNNTVQIISGLLTNGDALAIVGLIDYDYMIVNNILELATPVDIGVVIKVTAFTDHDNMLIRTERFNGTIERKFALSYSAYSDNYVWVYVDGTPLTARYDFEILDDLRTIHISDSVSVTTSSSIVITTVNPPSYGDTILGFRIFNDYFDRSHFNRLSAFYSTTLAKPLKNTDTEIYLTDGNGIIPPNPIINKPGIVIIDGERIEFMEKDGNVLKQLRRSTLGTGPAYFSNIGTQVIDQSLQQHIPYYETTLVQTTSTTATTYFINPVTTTATGAGIVLNTSIDAVNQLTVYYGGRQLRKNPLVINDKFYDQPILTLDPEFSINTATNELTLNILDYNGIVTDITIVQRKGYIWTGTESLLTSNVVQAEFLRDKKSMLPNIYYYGGEATLRDRNNTILSDDNNKPLEGY